MCTRNTLCLAARVCPCSFTLLHNDFRQFLDLCFFIGDKIRYTITHSLRITMCCVIKDEIGHALWYTIIIITCILDSLFHVMLVTNYAPPLLQDSNTPLHLASAQGHLEVVEVIISCGADIHLKNEVGVTGHWSALDISGTDNENTSWVFMMSYQDNNCQKMVCILLLLNIA